MMAAVVPWPWRAALCPACASSRCALLSVPSCVSDVCVHDLSVSQKVAAERVGVLDQQIVDILNALRA